MAALVTILNALGVDPQRAWKGPWRFYSEELLDCCISLEAVKEKGLDFAHLICLAKCNGLLVESFRTSASSEDEFRQQLLSSMKSNDTFIARFTCLSSNCIVYCALSKLIIQNQPRLLATVARRWVKPGMDITPRWGLTIQKATEF